MANKIKIGLVMEGGSMRGMFTAGVTDVMMENGIEFDGAWTVHHPVNFERKVVDDVSINVRKGEIIGISGLMGAGRTELAMSIFGKCYGENIS